MNASDTADIVRDCYAAYERKDRNALETAIGEPFSFTSPYDDHIDRRTYFERCWPNSANMRAIRIEKLFVEGNEAFVRYELEMFSGTTFRNAEWLRVADGKVVEVEVYFGSLPAGPPRPHA